MQGEEAMNLVNLLEKAIKEKDWSLVTKALFLVNGESQISTEDIPVVVNKQIANKIEPSKKNKFENKFVDDLSLETDLIEKNPKRREKTYRKPFSENDLYTHVKCSNCGLQLKIPAEEQRFRKMDSESSDFTCIKCIRKIR
jgi:hypothetical protein